MAVEKKNSGCPHVNQIHSKLSQHKEFGDIARLSDGDSSDDAIIGLQNLWHKKGYNGCTFSQVIAQEPTDYNWQAKVMTNLSSTIASEIDDTVKGAIENPTTRLLS